MTLAAVVFDLDYTLAVTDADRQELLDAAAEAAGVAPIDRDTYLATHDDTDADETRAPIFERLLDDGDPAAVATAYRKAVNDALVAMPGAEELIRDLRETYRVGLLTDGPRVAQESKLDALGWTDLFDAVVVTGTLPAGKPDPRTFETICAELGVDPAEAVYIGDRPETDVAGARAVGMKTVQVRFPGGREINPDADAVVDRADIAAELPAVLRSLDREDH